MSINLGDAIISVLVETAEANAQLEQFGASVPAKLAPAAAGANVLTSSIEKVGTTAASASAAAQIAFEGMVGKGQLADDMTKEFNKGLLDAVTSGKAAGQEMEELGEKSVLAAVSGTEKVRILDDAIGIKLPRGVTRFLSELLPMGAIMDAAFTASVIFIVVEALAKGVEKLIEWHEEAHKLELAQLDFGTAVANSFNGLDEKLLRAQIKADELTGDHLGALRKELELIDKQSFGELEHQFGILSKAADALFKQLETEWFTFNLGSKGAEAALTDFKAKYDFLLATGEREKASDLLAGTLKSAEEVLTLMQQLQAIKGKPDDTLEQTIHRNAEALKIVDELKARGASYDEKSYLAQQAQVATLAAMVNSQKEIATITNQEQANKKTEAANKAEADAERILKAQLASEQRAADEEDRLEDERRNKFIANFEQEEKEKIAATRTGSDERLKIIDEAIKAEEAHGFQDTAFYKSLQTQKLQAVQARIAQEQKAGLEGEKRDLTGLEQDAKREVEVAKESGREQEKAIEDLGKAKVLSQGQTSKRLIAAYEVEKDKVLAVLNNLLRDEQALMEKAANHLEQTKLNPGATPEQVSQAETMLKQIENAVANTTAQIAKVKSDANVKELALARNYYGQALAMAIAFGRQDVAAKLASNHAALLDAQGQLANAKARGLDTIAIEHQIKTLQKLEKELIKEAAIQKGNTGRLLHEFAQTSTAVRAYEDELDRSGQKTAAWGAGVGTVISEVAQIWAQGGITIEQALARMAAAELNAIAEVAEKEGTKQLALAFGSYPDAAGMAHHFAAAGLWFALAGGLSAASGALSGGGGSGSESGRGTASAAPTGAAPGASAGNQPTQVINVVHLASGGLVEKPTLVVIGDRGGGGGSREAVVPLDNRAALSAIAGAISAHMHSQPISIQLHSDIPGLAKVLSRKVDKGEIRLLASNSIRVTRRS